ncbi:isochorismate lyase [Chroococcus sp. FPU101]|uniref:isochorismate lyase n=1 Tax=Chroococcus sp. FPU101 TaxID=1974212 RepID=UPI001A90A7D0|nr:isochorismate lyase [Chroococcus sp. FPU101]GFE70631.1 chorismate mutase [Chroococcus sp. FPU101]
MNKSPDECNNINDIRIEIDAIDQQIITLFGERSKYVKAASKFKTDAASVRANKRFQAMLQQRRIWAENEGLNPDIIEKIYQDLINYFIAQEMNHWQAINQVLEPD